MICNKEIVVEKKEREQRERGRENFSHQTGEMIDHHQQILATYYY